MGDFLGFTFGGVHSSDLGITRVSGGDRYDEELHPEIKDRTAEVPGVNGNYYFGSDFGPKKIDIDFAFDHVTEKQFRDIRRIFGTKHIQKLVFDERPYKYYMAKIESPVELSYICFEERLRKKFSEVHNVGTIDTEYGAISGAVLTELPNGVRMVDDGHGNRIREKVDPWVYLDETERVYKGEGKITFICHFPFAKSNFKVLPEAGNEYYEGSEEWAISSGILSATDYARFDRYSNGEISIYNAGDIPTGFRLYCPFAMAPSTYNITLTYTIGQDVIHSLEINNLQPISGDDGFLINTDNSLIQGVKAITNISSGNVTYETTGNLYNQYIISGYFFKLEPTITMADNAKITITSNITDGFQIFYDYLYF